MLFDTGRADIKLKYDKAFYQAAKKNKKVAWLPIKKMG
jgi:hypothetical protein